MNDLAKLRQFKSGDPAKYLETEMRQNLMAIESTFKSLSAQPIVFYRKIDALSQPSGRILLPFTADFRIGNDVNSIFTGLDGSYELSISLINLQATLPGSVSLIANLNGSDTGSAIMLGSPGISVITTSTSLSFPMTLVSTDKLSFYFSNNTILTSTFLGGVLKITKLNI